MKPDGWCDGVLLAQLAKGKSLIASYFSAEILVNAVPIDDFLERIRVAGGEQGESPSPLERPAKFGRYLIWEGSLCWQLCPTPLLLDCNRGGGLIAIARTQAPHRQHPSFLLLRLFFWFQPCIEDAKVFFWGGLLWCLWQGKKPLVLRRRFHSFWRD